MKKALCLVVLLAASIAAGCSRSPSVDSLRDSFAAQLTANSAVQSLVRSGNEFSFRGPGREGAQQAQWRVHIDSAAVEPMEGEGGAFKGTVKSSWYADEQAVHMSEGSRRSNLPVALLANGLAQDCWAKWNPETRTWEWE